MFDIQVKRIHEYKRQLLNALRIAHLILEIESGRPPKVPRLIVIAGKAASSYDAAKRIIALISTLARYVDKHPELQAYLRVAFLPNYNVSMAEQLIPAADLSEQISTAGFEASGTGNMKFAMNGALTIGTRDGANVEIEDAVGPENFFAFGMSAEEVADASYAARKVVAHNAILQRTLARVADGHFCPEEPRRFAILVESLLENDRYRVLGDFASYISAQNTVDQTYLNAAKWHKHTAYNLTRMAGFSSDATIAGYAKDIWHT